MTRSRLALALVALSLVTGGEVRAQSARGFGLDAFDPSERGSSWFAADSLDLRGALRPAVGVVASWAHDPLVLYNPDGTTRATLVSDQLVAHLGGSLVVLDRLRFGLDLPFVPYATGDGGSIGGTTYAAPSSPSLGDARVSADVRLFGVHDDLLTVAAGAELHVPTGSTSGFSGDGSARFAGRVLGAGRVGVFVYAGQLAIEYRNRDDSFGGSSLGSDLRFAASAGLELLGDRLVVGPEVFGSTVVTGGAFQTMTTPLEGLLGAHYGVATDWRVGGGLGAGLTQGIGAPAERVLLSLEWAPALPPPDRDRDEIPDDADACPDVAGIRTDDPKTNGCPPPPPDRDRDGIDDAHDACPDVPGTKTDDPKTNGCPPDRDGDGVLDADDACPTEPGPRDPDPKKNGCPRAVLRDHKIRIADQVRFRTGSADLDPASDPILEAVRSVLIAHPEIAHLRVEGHTDDRGGAGLNQRLSDGRAASVRAWLVAHGVDAGRLTSHGYGQTQPLDTNRTEEGRRNNRRVEFTVLDAP